MRKTGCQKLIETFAKVSRYKVDVHDPNFNKPLSELNKDYSQKENHGIIHFKIKSNA